MFRSALFVLAFVPMLLEHALSARHERRLRAAGAVEPDDDVFAAMRVVYPLSFLAMIAESALHAGHAPGARVAGILMFVAAKALKYWAIATLGDRWTFRVLVPPGSGLIARGPYRWLRHPNYLAVAGELGGFALLAAAPVTGATSLIIFLALLRARIRVEERALGLRG